MALTSLILLLQCLHQGGGRYERTGVKRNLSVEELAERAIAVVMKIADLDTLEKLMELSKELYNTFDQLVLLALQNLLYDVVIFR